MWIWRKLCTGFGECCNHAGTRFGGGGFIFSWVASQSALPSMCVWSFSLVENACSFPTAACEEPTTRKRVRVAGPRAGHAHALAASLRQTSVVFALLALHRKKRKSWSWWSAKAMAATNLTCHVFACIDRPSLAFFSFHCSDSSCQASSTTALAAEDCCSSFISASLTTRIYHRPIRRKQ